MQVVLLGGSYRYIVTLLHQRRGGSVVVFTAFGGEVRHS